MIWRYMTFRIADISVGANMFGNRLTSHLQQSPRNVIRRLSLYTAVYLKLWHKLITSEKHTLSRVYVCHRHFLNAVNHIVGRSPGWRKQVGKVPGCK